MIYVYIESESGLYTVGFYAPSGKWNPESDHTTKEEAAERVHYLNGGKPEPIHQSRPDLTKQLATQPVQERLDVVNEKEVVR